MSKHTPGPWQTEDGNSVITIGDHKGRKIAVAVTQPYWKRFTDEDAANARLIAAAPELLEVLRRLTDKAESVMGDHKAVIVDARAVLAKVEAE